MKRDNRIVVDLNKVQWARYYYTNQHGESRNHDPRSYTSYYGKIYSDTELAAFLPQYPGETMLERYKRRGIDADVWVPMLCLKVTANTTLIYTGEKATALWKAWGERIFNNKKDKKK
jgi:hypothetical protein